ncbi:MAG TPA: LemA family protein [Candidatus Paceibacterota bacterium]
MKKSTIVILVVLVLIILYGFTTYNRLVTLSVNADTQWKQVEVNYQRRFDLIPNLVESVKGIMTQEQAIFLALAEARTRYSGAVTADEKASAAAQVEGSLGRLLVVMENYPELRSADTVQTLMSQLEGTENRISVERIRFNEAVRNYNLKVMRVPSSIIASIFGFDERAYFEITESADAVPQVKF